MDAGKKVLLHFHTSDVKILNAYHGNPCLLKHFSIFISYKKWILKIDIFRALYFMEFNLL